MPDVSSGWGRLTWDQANWDRAITLKTGWGAKSWGEDEWDELKDAVAIIAFGGDKTASNGTFKIEFPAADSSNAIIRLA